MHTYKVRVDSCESKSEIAQSCLTLCSPVDYSLPGSSNHGIFQARILGEKKRILEWVAIFFMHTYRVRVDRCIHI